MLWHKNIIDKRSFQPSLNYSEVLNRPYDQQLVNNTTFRYGYLSS